MDSEGLKLCGLQTSDLIAIIDIAVTTLIGIWIAIVVQNNLTKNRYLKEYFINEVKDIRDLYKGFVNLMYKNKISAVDIKDWFKVMSERTQNLNRFLHEKYTIDGALIIQKHAEVQQKITSMEEFNECYKEQVVLFSNSSKNEILKMHSELSCILTQRVIDINGAKKKWIKTKKNKT